MSSTVTVGSARGVRGVGHLLSALGVIFALAGIGAWVFTAMQLGNQGITVPSDANFMANSRVNNPLSALAQADAISMHQHHGAEQALIEAGIAIPDGVPLTYSGLTASNFPDASAEQLEVIAAQRATAQTASGLQSSLFTSVLAFGVALFSFGVGVACMLAGRGFKKLASVPTVEVTDDDAPVIEAPSYRAPEPVPAPVALDVPPAPEAPSLADDAAAASQEVEPIEASGEASGVDVAENAANESGIADL